MRYSNKEINKKIFIFFEKYTKDIKINKINFKKIDPKEINLRDVVKRIRSIKKLKEKLALTVLILLLPAIYNLCKDRNIGIYSANKIKLENINEESFPYHNIDYFDLDNTMIGEITSINFNDYDDDLYEIIDGGSYELSGELDGTLYIEAKRETVHLFLNNVTINSSDGPAIIVDDAEKVIITSLPNTNNLITDSGRYKENTDYVSAIQSEADLTFNGSGFIEIYGLYKDGIRSKDTVKVVDGSLSIHAKRTAIHATDGINIAGGSLFIATEKYGFKTTKDGINNRGALIIDGGEITIVAGNYSFVSEAPIYIFNCEIHENSASRYLVNDSTYEEDGCFK